MLHYVTTLNLIKLAIKHKQNSIKIVYNKKTQRILFTLLKLNLIKGWVWHNKYEIKVYVNINFSKTLLLITKPSQIYILKLKQLDKLIAKQNSFSIYLSTSSGVISLVEAVKKKNGGALVFALV